MVFSQGNWELGAAHPDVGVRGGERIHRRLRAALTPPPPGSLPLLRALQVQRQCLLLPDKTWRLLETAILNIITQILQWCHILQELVRPAPRLDVPRVPCNDLARALDV